MTEQQAFLLKMLKEIHAICENNGIKYCIAGGSLIGAVRHGGFLPWDDDVDIYMTRDNWEKFVTVCKTDLPPNRILQAPELDDAYTNTFPRYMSTDTTQIHMHQILDESPAGVIIDILVLDPLPDNPEVFQSYTRDLMLYSDLINYSVNCGRRFGVKTIDFLLHLILDGAFGTSYTRRYFEKRLAQYFDPDGSIYVMRWGGNPLVFPRWWFDEYEYCRFEDFNVMIPCAVNEYLVYHYGDEWAIIPNQSGRVSHDAVLALGISYEVTRKATAVSPKEKQRMLRMLKLRKVLLFINAKIGFSVQEEILRQQAECVRLDLYARLENSGMDICPIENVKDLGLYEEIFDRFFSWQLSAKAIGRDDFAGVYRYNHPVVCNLKNEVFFAAIYILFSTERISKAFRLLEIRAHDGKLDSKADKVKNAILVFRQAVNHYYHKRFDESLILTEELLTSYPSNISFLKLRCLNLLINPALNVSLLEETFTLAQMLYPEDGDFMKYKGDVFYTHGKATKANSQYQKAVNCTNNGISLLDIRRKSNIAPSGHVVTNEAKGTPDRKQYHSDKQQIYMQLFNELIDLCSHNEIPYIIHPRMALWLQEKIVPPNYSAFSIIMYPDDAMELVKVIENSLASNRAIEHMCNSSRYPNLTIHYVDTGTLRLDINNGNNIKHPGMYATVIIVPPKKPSKALRRSFAAWKDTCYRHAGFLSGKARLRAAAFVLVSTVIGRKRMARFIMSRIVKECNCSEGKITIGRQLYSIKSEWMAECKQLSFMGKKYRIPKDMDGYLKQTLGSKYSNIISNSEKSGSAIDIDSNALESTLVSYRDYIATGVIKKDFFRRRRNLYVRSVYSRTAKRRFDSAFAWVKEQVKKEIQVEGIRSAVSMQLLNGALPISAVTKRAMHDDAETLSMIIRAYSDTVKPLDNSRFQEFDCGLFFSVLKLVQTIDVKETRKLQKKHGISGTAT